MTDGTFSGAGAEGLQPSGETPQNDEVRWPLALGLGALAGTVAGVVVIALGPILGPDAALDSASTPFIENVGGTAVGVPSGRLARTLQEARR